MTTGALALVAYGLAHVAPTFSTLIWVVLVGAVVRNVIGSRPVLDPGLRFATTRILRVGVGLLGIRMSLELLSSIGWRGSLIVVVSLTSTFLVTLWVGRLLRLSRGLVLLIASGSAICGASAILAMQSVGDARDEEVAVAVATVTLFGTVAMLLMPFLGVHVLHLSTRGYAVWAGASVHEVAQVVGATGAVSAAALQIGTVVKLARLTLLAPVVGAVGTLRHREAATRGLPVPAFVLAFLALLLVRSTGLVPDGVVHATVTVDTVLLTGALAALGMGVDLRRMRQLGPRPLVLGLASWLFIGGISLALVLALY